MNRQSPLCSRAVCFLVCMLLLLVLPAWLKAQVVTLVPSAVKVVGTGTGGFTGDSGTSQTSVELNSPAYVAFDTSGNLYLTDTLNNCVRKVDTSGNISTIAGLVVSGQGDTCNTATNATPTPTQGLLQPTGIAVDASGNLYIADTGHNCVRKLANGNTGTKSLTAVSGTCTSTPLLSATPMPNAVIVDSSSNLYISLRDTADGINQVVKHTNGAAATSLCVMAGALGSNALLTCSGVTNTVTLSSPAGLVLDPIGNLYLADTGNNCVREIAGLTTISTVVGQCTNDGSGSSAVSLHNPYGLAFGTSGGILISSTSPDNIYSYHSNTGTNVLLAGVPAGTAGGYSTTQDGSAASTITLHAPEGMVEDAMGNVYLADSGNHIIRELLFNTHFPSTPVNSNSSTALVTMTINQAANLSTNIGSDFKIVSSTCTGSLTAAASGNPPNFCQIGVQFHPTLPGVRSLPLVVSDSTSGTTVSSGLTGIGTGSYAIFSPGIIATAASSTSTPVSAITDWQGNAYYLENGSGGVDVKKIPAGGGSPITVIAAGSGLVTPVAITADAAGNLYIVDTASKNIQMYSADTKALSVFASGLTSPVAAVSDQNGNIYVAQQGTAHNVIELYAHGGTRIVTGSGTDSTANNEAATLASLLTPSGLAIDGAGDLYVSDSGRHRVYYVDNKGIIHYLAGNGTTVTTQPGVALDTALIAPSSLAVDAAGDLYIADASANRVWVAYAATAQAVNMVSLAGTGQAGYSGDNGPSTNAKLNGPLSVANDNAGNLWIADSGNKVIREVTYPSPSINFGSVALNTTSPAQTVAVWDIGTDNMSQTSAISISNGQFATNTATTTCGLTLLAGGTCNLGFTFSPTSGGATSATATYDNTAANNPNLISLTGNAHTLLTLTAVAPPETEVYGSGFSPAMNFTFTGTSPTGTITFSLPGNTLCSVSGTLTAVNSCAAANTGLPVGTYTVTVTYSGDTNYAAISTTATLTITPAPLTVVTDNKTRVYDTANPTLTGSVSGAVNGDSFTVAFSTTATITSAVGTYPITATLTPVGTSSLSNYTVSNPGGTLTITATSSATLTVTVACTTKIFGAVNPTFTSTIAGALNGDTFTLTYNTTATTTSPVGSYPVSVTVSGADAANYANIVVVPCTLSVTPAPTTTTLASSGTPATIGTSVTFTANVSAPGSTIAPTGTVSFYDSSTLLGTGTLSGGVATYTTASLSAGSHTINASYPTSTNYTGSSATLTQIMNVPMGSFAISASPSTQLIRGAGTTTWQVTVTASGGFVGPVALTCSGLPSDASCTFAQSTLQLTGGGTQNTTMSTTTTLQDAALRIPFAPARESHLVMAALLPFGLGAASLLVLFAGTRKRKQIAMRLMLVLVLLLGAFGASGCGCPSTLFASYPITITGTSVNGGPGPATTQVTLTVGM